MKFLKEIKRHRNSAEWQNKNGKYYYFILRYKKNLEKKTFTKQQCLFCMINSSPFMLILWIWNVISRFSKIFHMRQKKGLHAIIVWGKKSRLRCLLRVKGLVICFYLGWSGSIHNSMFESYQTDCFDTFYKSALQVWLF